MIVGLGSEGVSQGMDALSQILAAQNTPTTIDVNTVSGQGQFNPTLEQAVSTSYGTYLILGIIGLGLILIR